MCALHESETGLGAGVIVSANRALMDKCGLAEAASAAVAQSPAASGSLTALARLLGPYAPSASGEVLVDETFLDEPRSIYRRRRWSHEEKKAIVSETEQPGLSVSAVARKYAIAPRLLFSWRRQLAEEVQLTSRYSARMVPIGQIRRLEERVSELEQALLEKDELIKSLAARATSVDFSFVGEQEPCCVT